MHFLHLVHFMCQLQIKLHFCLSSALSMYSSEYSMNEALVYAKDDNTRAAVKQYIE